MIPFLQLTPGEDAAAVRDGDRAGRRARMVRARPGAGGVRAGVRRRVRRRPVGRRRHGHRRAGDRAARARHRAGRRGDHVTAVGRLHRAGHHDGRRASGVRRHRSGAAHASIPRRPRRPSRRERRRSCRCTCTASPPTCRRLPPSPRATSLPSSKTAARRTSRRAHGQPVGSFGAAAAYSFYPTKNLGALGDGGALTTNDSAIADRAKRLRNGGQTDRYHHAEFGVNSRLDEMQAAILRARLPFLPAGPRGGGSSARKYRDALEGVTSVVVPPELDAGHVYHLFPVLSPARDALQAHLRIDGVETLIHYPVPIPRQPALASRARQPTVRSPTRVCDEILSLPLYPRLDERAVRAVAGAVAAGPAAGRPSRSDRGTLNPCFSSLQVAVVGWLPGAVLFRAPFADRARRAALDPEERLFWAVILSVAVSLSVVLALAFLDRYTFAAPAGRRRRVRARACGDRPVRSSARRAAQLATAAALLPVMLIALAAWRFFPPAEYVHRRQGSRRLHERGHSDRAARHARLRGSGRRVGAAVRTRSVLSLAPAPATTTASGSWGSSIIDPDRGTVVGQFPHLFPASIAIGYGIDGLTGARRDGRCLGRRSACSPSTSWRDGCSADGGRVRRARCCSLERRSGLVRALSERRNRDAGAAVRGAAGDRARARGRRRVLRAGRGGRCSGCCCSCASTPCSRSPAFSPALGLLVMTARPAAAIGVPGRRCGAVARAGGVLPARVRCARTRAIADRRS